MLFRLAAAALAVGCAAIIIFTNRDCAKKEEELVEINEKISVCEKENAELQRVLDKNDLSSYMEEIALEERGYAYPDERRFYDTSRD